MGAWDELGGAVFHTLRIGEKVITGKKEDGKMNVGGGFSMRDQVMGIVVLMPMTEAASIARFEEVVVEHMTVSGNQVLGERDDRFEIEEGESGATALEHPIAQNKRFAVVDGLAILFNGAIEISFQLLDELGLQEAFEEKEAVTMEAGDPFIDGLSFDVLEGFSDEFGVAPENGAIGIESGGSHGDGR